MRRTLYYYKNRFNQEITFQDGNVAEKSCNCPKQDCEHLRKILKDIGK